MQYDEQLKKVFLENGIIPSFNDNTGEIQIDSIQFVSLIVDIEKEFMINFPDEYLGGDMLKNYDDYLHVVTQLKKDSLQIN